MANKSLRAFAVSAAIFTAFSAGSARKADLVVTGIVNKPCDHIARMYATLLSTPHTSWRIDSITANIDGTGLVGAIDVDGIDFRRYFQWEEEGAIELEIDFPVDSIMGTGTLILHTVTGDESFMYNLPYRNTKN